MGGPVARRKRRRARERMLTAALDYAAHDWPVCPGAHPVAGGPRACSCDRVGCPSPGAHALSPSWSMRATTDPEALRTCWTQDPDANVVLPTGRVFDVLDVPAEAGAVANARLDRAGLRPGPVAACGSQRYYFFVATRGAPESEDEWWQSDLDCHLDAEPETVPETEGLRWHCRDSYIVAPPSALPSGTQVGWVRRPGRRGPLPDPLLLLETLAEACQETGTESAPHGSGTRPT